MRAFASKRMDGSMLDGNSLGPVLVAIPPVLRTQGIHQHLFLSEGAFGNPRAPSEDIAATLPVDCSDTWRVFRDAECHAPMPVERTSCGLIRFGRTERPILAV